MFPPIPVLEKKGNLYYPPRKSLRKEGGHRYGKDTGKP
jgi:hypothetical protein